MARLSLSLLGAPDVRHGGRQLILPTRKTLAILLYLGAEGGRHTRDKLMAFFWPGSDGLRARASLRRALSSIRHALDDPGHAPSSHHLAVDQTFVSIVADSDVDVDLHLVEKALLSGHIPPGLDPVRTRQAELYKKQIELLERAAGLRRGEFLEGFSLPDAPAFDDWLTLQREVWHRKIGLLLEQLSQLQAEAGEVTRATSTARLQVAHDPFNEPAYQNLMRLLLASGDRKGAERAYADLQNVLLTEWGTKPSAQSQVLAARIGVEMAPKPPDGRVSALSFPSNVLFERHMVGRAAEFRELLESFYAAGLGEPQSVVVSGEAGIGKTRLVTEFLGWASAHGANVLQGRAFEMSGRLPYQAVTDAMRAGLERHNSPDDLLDDVWLAELGMLMPELRERYPDLPLAGRHNVVKTRLFEATSRLLNALASHQPLVLFIDDLQWADVASIDLLQYVMRRWSDEGTPALLLLSLRSEPPHRHARAGTEAAWQLVATLMREAPCKRLMLEALTEDDTLRLVLSLSGTPQEAGLAQKETLAPLVNFGMQLFTETGGQPFFITETLKALRERGHITLKEIRSEEWVMEIPPAASDFNLRGFVASGVVEMVRGRLARLSRDATTLLVAGAVLGRDFDFETLCSVAGLSEDAALAILEQLLGGRLLRERQLNEGPSSEVRYLFAHDMIRAVVYTEAGASRRRVFHRRALDSMLARNTPPAELARHALAAGQVALAFHLSLAAGDAALRLFAVQDAIAHYEQARTLGVRGQGLGIRGMSESEGEGRLGDSTRSSGEEMLRFR